MNKIQPKISYDSESKVLSIQINKNKSVDSDIQGNLVIDYDSQGKIVKINIYQINFDRFKKTLESTEIPFISESSLIYR